MEASIWKAATLALLGHARLRRFDAMFSRGRKPRPRAWALALVALALVAGAVSAQEVTYYHTDALGSPIAITDAGGSVIERSEYEPYGALSNHPLDDGPSYAGHVADSNTELNYMQQRYYDPEIGIFLSIDPVSAMENPVVTFNSYRYANSNPYRFVDRDGRYGTLSDKYREVSKMCEMTCVKEGDGGGIKGWWAKKKAEATENAERVGAALNGDWKTTVRDASVKIGWTAPDYGLGSGTIQIGLENGHPAVDFNGGWGAAGGAGIDLVTNWVSTPETAGQPRVWFGGNMRGSLSIGPLRGKAILADGALVIAPGSGIKRYSEQPGMSGDLRPSATMSASASGGGFIHIGFVAPNSIIPGED